MFMFVTSQPIQNNVASGSLAIIILEKWFPLRGERAHSLKLFCMYDKRFEIYRMEEETDPQTNNLPKVKIFSTLQVHYLI